MASFLDASGGIQQLPLDVTMYRQASEAGMSFQHYVNRAYPTDAARHGTVFAQLCESEGIILQGNRETGIRSSTLSEILEGRPQMQGGVVVKDAIPASRILFPAVMMQAVEDRLIANMTMTADAFEGMIALDEGINGERFEQPQINLTKAGDGRHQAIAQLAMPATMLTITSADVARKIPTFSLGMEISDQALKASTLDFVSMSLARQAAVERNERAQGYMLALLNGDPDNGDASLSSLGKVSTTTSFDAAATGGVVTQAAWVGYMTKNSQLRTLDYIITDLASILAIENRTGKPTVVTDDPNSTRINTTFQVVNPLWPTTIKSFLVVDTAWPASTVMGMDSRYGIRRVRNLTAEYQAIESYVMRRKQEMRLDFGEIVTRIYSDGSAFEVMTIA